jgi:hypothetical protein
VAVRGLAPTIGLIAILNERHAQQPMAAEPSVVSAVQGLVVPHIGRTIDSTVEAINAGLQSLKSGRSTLGELAVIVDRNLEEAS